MITNKSQENLYFSQSEEKINKLANNYSSKQNSIESHTNIQIEKINDELISSIRSSKENQMDTNNDRYPYCIVWTPIPLITWFFPFIGHMGICTSNGIIRDFAGPYFVSENNMGFGRPTKYLRLNSENIPFATNKRETWDRAVAEASDEYKKHMHNLFCDNCHSHVAYALNLMSYNNSSKWNMFNLCYMIFLKGSYVSFTGFLKTWGPFIILVFIILVIISIILLN